MRSYGWLFALLGATALHAQEASPVDRALLDHDLVPASSSRLAPLLRRFETEADAVVVQPVRDMALKVLTGSLVGEGMLTEQAMLVFFDLRDDDFTRDGFSRVIARVIRIVTADSAEPRTSAGVMNTFT